MSDGLTWKLVVAALLSGCAYSQSAVFIPFVGCPSTGQIERFDAPTGSDALITLRAQDAEALAYYKSADGITVLAPRGWYCQGRSGSDGAILILSAKPLVETPKETAIEVRYISAGSSGRYALAEIVARVFPAYHRYSHRVWDLSSPLPSGPFLNDALNYRSKTVVEYRTPAQTDGLGNFYSGLGKNDMPITGIAVLQIERGTGTVKGLALLSVRLPPSLVRLAPTIRHYFESEAATGEGK